MSTASTDTYYLGLLISPQPPHEYDPNPRIESWEYLQSQQYILRNLAFDKVPPPLVIPPGLTTSERNEFVEAHNKLGDAYVIQSIEQNSVAIVIEGWSRRGGDVPFTEECWESLQPGVIVHEWWDGYGSMGRQIYIDGERVFSDEVGEEVLMDQYREWEGFANFVGRTPDEVEFFSRLWESVDAWKENNAIERELLRMKRAKAARSKA